MIVRVAGLPAAAVEAFSSRLLPEELREVLRVEEELGAARAALVDRLYAGLSGSPPDLRRFLLAVKRDSFNGRSLRPHRGDHRWPALRGLDGGLVDSILELEDLLEARQAGFEQTWRREREREHRQLVEIFSDRPFLRGVTLASPLLGRSLQRLAGRPASTQGRRERRLVLAALRYVSRAALKLSPYSTLTRLALGRVTRATDSVNGDGLALRASNWRERSLLRIQRYRLDQIWSLLARVPELRRDLTVEANDTLEEIAPGRYRLLKPGSWALGEDGALQFVQDALVTARLTGPLPTAVSAALAGERISYGELIARLERALPGSAADEITEAVDELVQAGFLCLLPPWPGNEGHLERRMLGDLGSSPEMAEVVRALERLVELEASFPAADAAEVVAALDPQIEEIGRAASQAARAEARLSRLKKSDFYEDVFLLPPAGPAGELLEVPGGAVRRVVEDLAPLAQVADLFSRRHDFHQALAGLLAQRWPGREEVGLLELFAEVQPLWRAFTELDLAAARSGDRAATFDPWGRRAMEDLRRLRQEVLEQLGGCIVPGEDAGESHLDGERLRRLLDRLPEPHRRAVDACFFLQPLDAGGRRWMLNRLTEGTGRFGSRFAPVMDEALCRSYTAHLRARSSQEREAGRAELLDLAWVQGDTLNVRGAQTRSVLALPGAPRVAPPAVPVRLRDLRVRLDGGEPRLVDVAGRWFLPVHLGGAAPDFMPPLARLLSLLGPGPLHPVLPRPGSRQEDGRTVRDRLVCGSTVLLRKRWTLPSAPLAAEVADAGEAESFSRIHRWRTMQGLPERLFLRERVLHGTRGIFPKPQYLDLTSPSFVEIFRSILRVDPGPLVFEEALPSPEAFLRDGAGTRWATELLLDTLALRPVVPEPSAGELPDLSVPAPCEGHCSRNEPAAAHSTKGVT